MIRVITSQYNAVCVHTHKSQCLNTTLCVCTLDAMSQFNAVCVHTHKTHCLNTTLRVCTHIRRNACTYIYFSICIHLHTCYVPYIIHICVHVPPCWWAFRGEHSTAHQRSHPCLKKNSKIKKKFKKFNGSIAEPSMPRQAFSKVSTCKVSTSVHFKSLPRCIQGPYPRTLLYNITI